jgi:hypothetical protein
MEVSLGVAARTLTIVIVTIFPAEALDRRPRLDQRAIDREVIARQRPLHLRLGQNRRKELGCDLSLQQPVTVLGERRMVPNRIIHAETDKPPEQQVELQPLHQLALGADAIERL